MRQIKVGTASSLGVNPADIQTFYKTNWARQIALSDPAFYSWQFINNPTNTGIDECIVAVADNVLCGAMGVNSRNFYLKEKIVNGGELTTWVVSDGMKGKGVGPAILSFLVEKYDVLIGMGITKEALPLYLRYGFKYLRSIPRYLRLLNLKAVAEYSIIDPLALKLAKMRGGRILSSPYKKLSVDNETLDDIFLKFSKKYHLFSRSAIDLLWRYGQHPVYRYEFHLIYELNSENKSIIVTRSQGLPNGQKILRVMDIFGDDGALLPALAFIDSYCLENNYALADFFCTSIRVSSKLVANGWFSAIDEDFFQFPHLFEPIELRVPSSTSLIYWAKRDIETLADHSSLYITKEDADFDRPVYIGE